MTPRSSRSDDRTRGGASAVEVLVALVLFVVVLQAAWSVTSAQRRAAQRLATAAQELATERTVAWVLRRELAAGLPGRDRGPPAGDTVSLRAFRGVGIPCVVPSSWTGSIEVRWRGSRAPDPAKDSVLALTSGGVWRAGRLVDRSGGGACSPGPGRPERWTVEGVGPDAPTLLRVFERGSYHLAGGALRYRRGLGGRQPLTPPLLEDGSSGLEAGPGGRVGVRVSFRGDSTGWLRSFEPWSR